MQLSAIEDNQTHLFTKGNRTHPFDSCGAGCQASHGLEINRTHPFDSGGAGCQVLHVMEINQRQSNSPVRFGWHRMPSAAWPGDNSKAIELTRSTWVVQDAKHFMALRAIEGNRTHLFDSGSTGCQVLNGLGCNQRQSISPVRLGQRRMPSTSWPWVQSCIVVVVKVVKGLVETCRQGNYSS